eukprot:CAMPEP_0202864816 /NCGR_PEP_ID=MMETSP1391-20130828/4902_1 /ASSEMBLY_ACC=CAM_ASM_000867 /TAXON_ID=1034604 /ORGANISM="Chlamydomonas leiostraca, Strain SAG 11-49" /LENGTH=105 /DNA_ID=CAMNT_0049544587 /DNA_START=72 /DNA_END=390 /DNA_ORIENTATION=+
MASDLKQQLQQAIDVAVEYGRPIVHWGFIPAVILVGMLATKPRPTIGQLSSLGDAAHSASDTGCVTSVCPGTHLRKGAVMMQLVQARMPAADCCTQAMQEWQQGG